MSAGITLLCPQVYDRVLTAQSALTDSAIRTMRVENSINDNVLNHVERKIDTVGWSGSVSTCCLNRPDNMCFCILGHAACAVTALSIHVIPSWPNVGSIQMRREAYLNQFEGFRSKCSFETAFYTVLFFFFFNRRQITRIILASTKVVVLLLSASKEKDCTKAIEVEMVEHRRATNRTQAGFTNIASSCGPAR
jgi:hypothetical protein